MSQSEARRVPAVSQARPYSEDRKATAVTMPHRSPAMAPRSPIIEARTSKGMPGRLTSRKEDEVPRNSKGGILVTDEELRAAFDFFDIDNSGTISLANLRKRLSVFYKNMPAKEYRFLMNNKNEMTFEELRDLLVDNEVKNFDPVVEAFKVYDPDNTGFVNRHVLRSIFENLGFGEVTDEDLDILTETADVDGDGKISLADFRKMLTFNASKEAARSSSGAADTTSTPDDDSPPAKGAPPAAKNTPATPDSGSDKDAPPS